MRTVKLWMGLGVATVIPATDALLDHIDLTTLTPAIYAASYLEGGEGGEGGEKAATDEGGEGGEAGGSAPAVGFYGDLDDALEKMFGGEGGEHGAGLSKMWPSVIAPAMTGDQVKQAMTGRTLVTPAHVAYYFSKKGSVEGWYAAWEKRDTKECPVPEVEDLYFYEKAADTCWYNNTLPLKGSWKVDNNQLCIDAKWKGGSVDSCWYVTVLLDDIALFKTDGDIEGKGMKLLDGKVLD
ncbi:hypothetical protein [Kordiimonas pumila]|uniref:Uncharacterized protein n=1 Tax=Kordiimonas pumila TaxID=2161677 RepID=A0ABV7D5T9_9PROT|nr:hypothetical protein [Kordiimonas pumila]